jgi:hypothetical protein
MKSGDYSISRDDKYHSDEFAEIADREFVQRTFTTHAALLAKERLNGCTVYSDYHGEPYDNSKFDLVEGGWDHEHCSICFFTIKDGHTYWQNTNRIELLCDPCHEAMLRA